jgi:hypothetical protein
LEAALFWLFGCGLLLLSTPGVHLRLLDPLENAYLWQRASVLADLLLVYGAFLIILGIWSQVLAQRGTSLSAETSRHFADIRLLVRDDLLKAVRRALVSPRQVRWLLAVICLGVAVRGYFLVQPMRYDEANTFLTFVNGDFTRMFSYTFPNNHVLHTILVRLVTSMLGAHPSTIRLPAFVAGVIAIPMVFCLGRVLLRQRTAAFATIAVAVFPYLILYSTNARGYTLIVFFTLMLMFVALRTAAAPSKASSALLSAIAALGLLTVPTMAFPIAGVYLWLTCLLLLNGNPARYVLRDFVIPCALLTVVFTAVFYTPVILVSNGVDPLLANDYVAAQGSEEFFRRLPAHLSSTFEDFSRDVPGPILFAWAVLMAFGVYSALKRRDWPILLLVPSVLAAGAVLLLLKHAIPHPRTWIFLLPVALILADAGWSHCLAGFPRRLQWRIHRGFIFAAACYAVWLISTNAIAHYPDTGAFPDAPAVARHLKPIMKDGDKVHAAIPADYPLYFYLWYDDVRDFRGEATQEEATYVVVQKDNYEFEPPVEQAVIKLFEVADAAVYQVVRDEAPVEQKTEDSSVSP